MKRSLLITSVVIAAGLLGGCTVNSDGTPSAESTSATPPIDRALLDTGDYPTQPLAPLGIATDQDVLQIEAHRMSDYVAVPFEIDPELTKPQRSTAFPTKFIFSQQDLTGVVLNPGQVDAPANTTGILGFVSSAQIPTVTAQDRNRVLVQSVLRYNDAATAAAAARQMHEAQVKANKATEEKLPGLPDTLVSSSLDSRGNLHTLEAFTPHGFYLLFTRAGDTLDQSDWTTTTIANALAVQKPLIDTFKPTPTAEQGGSASGRPQKDPHNILIYAIPTDDPKPHQNAVYGPRGTAHQSTKPALTYKTLIAVGVEHTAINKTGVYRAETPAGAQKMMDTFIDDSIAAGSYVLAPSPTGLSNATCMTEEISEVDLCMVVNGRYFAEAAAIGDRTDVHQQISAQYLILKEADQ